MNNETRYLLFDNQQLKAWRICPRYWQYRHFYHRTKFIDSSLPARFGQAAHKGFAVWYTSESKEEAILEAIKTLKATPEEWTEWRNDQKLQQVLEMSIEKEFPCDILAVTQENGDQVKLVEKPFSVELIDPPIYDNIVAGTGKSLSEVLQDLGYDEILYSGIIDLIGSNDAGNWVIDHKTNSLIRMTAPRGGTPYIGQAFWDQFNLSAQMTGYCYAMGKMLQKPCNGFMINGLGINTNHCVVERRFFTRTPQQITEWKINRISEIFNIVSLLWNFRQNNFKWATMNEDQCVQYQKLCEYSQLCACGNTGLRDQLLVNSYKEKPWDIFKRDEEPTV